jgi:membrane-associated protein
MNTLLEFYYQLTNPELIITNGGLFLILLIIFAENGIFFGFFLPGDTLLFTTGLLISTNVFKIDITLAVVSITLASYAGSFFGYWFGKKTGHHILDKNESIFFKRKYIFTAEAFFNKHGAMAIIMARFLPIVRTFAPIFAGMIKYKLSTFIYYSLIGGLLWAVSLTLGGYFLGNIFPSSKKHIDIILICIIIITWIPVVLTYFKERKKVNSLKNE